MREQGRVLLQLRPEGRFRQVSSSSFGSAVEFWLKLAPRTARDRVRVAEILDQCPGLEGLFLQGRISVCQVLALSPLVRKGKGKRATTGEGTAAMTEGGGREAAGEGTAGTIGGEERGAAAADLADWLQAGEDDSVRALKARVKERVQAERRSARPEREPGDASPGCDGRLEADADADPDADPPFRAARLPVPQLVAAEFEETMELARKQLGWDAPLYECLGAVLAETSPDAVDRQRVRKEAERIARERGFSLREVIRHAEELGVERVARICAGADSEEEAVAEAREENGRPAPRRLSWQAAEPDRPNSSVARTIALGMRAAVWKEGEPRPKKRGDCEESGPRTPIRFPAPAASRRQPRSRKRRSRRRSLPPVPGSIERAKRTADDIEQYLADLAGLIEPAAPADPIDALERARQLVLLEQPARIFQALLLRDLRDTRGLYRAGYANTEEFCRRELKLSDRAARLAVREAECLESSPALRDAFGRGVITAAQAARIVRLVGVNPMLDGSLAEEQSRRIAGFCERARVVTVRQFERECRFFLRLQAFSLPLFSACRGPLPNPEIEPRLLRELHRLGWSRKRIKRALRAGGAGARKDLPLPQAWGAESGGQLPGGGSGIHGAADARRAVEAQQFGGECGGSFPAKAGGPSPAKTGEQLPPRKLACRWAEEDMAPEEIEDLVATDPAANHLLMRRLEALLNLLIIASADPKIREGSSLPMALALAEEEHPGSRNPFAASADESGSGGRLSGGSITRSAGRSGDPWAAEPFRAWTDLRIAAPEAVIEHWKAALGNLVWEDGVAPWVAARGLLQEARAQWELQDPERIPVRNGLLKRDGCRCRAPGCPKRAQMEGHHAEFRAHGGSDRMYNLGMLCISHHRQVHAGLMKVTGRAPGRRYEMGLRPGKPALRVLIGERIVMDRLR